MAERTLTDDDEGKKVVSADGDEIGIVTDVRNDTAYVDPDPGITDTVMSKLGWKSAGEEDYPLENSRIDAITDDEVRLERNL